MTTHSEEEWRAAPESLRNQGRSYESALVPPRAARLQLPVHRLQAALGIAQLEKLDRILALRARRPRRATASCSPASTASRRRSRDDADHRRSWFVYVVEARRAASTASRDRALAGARASRRRTYVPCVHLQPYMRERYGFAEGLCPVAEDAARADARAAVLRAHRRDDQERVVEALARAVG